MTAGPAVSATTLRHAGGLRGWSTPLAEKHVLGLIRQESGGTRQIKLTSHSRARDRKYDYQPNM
jgi:hypothetical protein